MGDKTNRETHCVHFESSCSFLFLFCFGFHSSAVLMLSVEQAAAFRYSTVHRYITGCTFKQEAAENGSGWLGSSSAPQWWSYSACGSPAPLLLLLIFLLKVACLVLPLALRMKLAEHGWKALVGIKTHGTWVRNLLLGGWGVIAWWAKYVLVPAKHSLHAISGPDKRASIHRNLHLQVQHCVP